MPTAPNPIYSIGHKPRPRRGFTLVEMLVVIGIIVLLLGLSVVGFSQIAKHSKAQHTKAALETMKAIMTEYEASAGKQNLASFINYWNSVPLPATVNNVTIKILIPPSTTTYSWQEYSDRALAVLLQLPANKAVLDKLPSEQVKIVQWPITNPPKLPHTGFDFYEILDGYGHALLFVPSVGARITSAAGGSVTNKVIQSDGVLHAPNAPFLPLNPNPRYFWMSAGADNDPAVGDDNQYTFDQ